MILDNFIVERVIGLVDGAEHNAALLSVSVLTTAPFARQLDRAASVAGNIAHALNAHKAVAQVRKSVPGTSTTVQGAQRIVVSASCDNSAATGARSVTVRNPNGEMAMCDRCLTVTSGPIIH
jgi:hypothetical protein